MSYDDWKTTEPWDPYNHMPSDRERRERAELNETGRMISKDLWLHFCKMEEQYNDMVDALESIANVYHARACMLDTCGCAQDLALAVLQRNGYDLGVR